MIEEAEPVESSIPAQMPKGIMVDDEEYFPVHEDWALGYRDIGGEG